MENTSSFLDNETHVTLMIDYLRVLQEGRVKPNSSQHTNDATARDSKDNLEDINAVKDELNEIFNTKKVTRN